jgi:hypothetical protein
MHSNVVQRFLNMINTNVKNLHADNITKQLKIEYAAMFHYPVAGKKL